MSVLGISPLGTGTGPFGGPGLITVLGVIQTATNEIIVVCDKVPRVLNDGAFDDGADPSHYTISAIDPTVTPDSGEPFIPPGEYKATWTPTIVSASLDPNDDQQIILRTDVKIEARVRYSLLIDYLEGLDGETFAGTTTFYFRGLVPVRRYRRIAQLGKAGDPYADFADGFVASEGDTPVPVGLTLAGAGNFTRVTGAASTKQRLQRRLLSTRGRWLIFSPRYGTAYQTNALARNSAIQTLVNEIAEGARSEPDVIAAQCQAAVANNTIDITLTVRTRDNSTFEVNQIFQI